MKSTLTIKDLCVSHDLDQKAMSAVWGGTGPVVLQHESLHAQHYPAPAPAPAPSPDPHGQTLSPPGGFPPNGGGTFGVPL